MSGEWGPDGGGIRLGSAGTADSPYAWLLARIVPVAPIAIQARADLTAALLDDLTHLTPPHCSMSLAMLHVIMPSDADDLSDSIESTRRAPARLESYLRWGITFDSAAPGATLQARVASKHVQRAYASASAALRLRYQLKPVISAAYDAALRAEVSARRIVELVCAEWGATTDWMAPMQLQPALDLLLRQRRFAAIQCTIESRAEEAEENERAEEDEEDSESAAGDASVASDAARPRFCSHIAALGAATDRVALRLLAKELRGQGVLTLSRASGVKPPRVRVIRPRNTQDDQRIARNLIAPAASSSNLAEQITYIRDEAVTLLPLPFKTE